MLAAVVALAEPAVADDALRGFFAFFVGAAELLGGHGGWCVCVCVECVEGCGGRVMGDTVGRCEVGVRWVDDEVMLGARLVRW